MANSTSTPPAETSPSSNGICTKCDEYEHEFPNAHTLKYFLDDVADGKGKKDHKKQGLKKDQPPLSALDELLETVNALLNCKGGGKIIIHVDDNNKTDKFNSKVDPELVKLIPDNSLFHDVYKEDFLDDKHLMLTVKLRRDTSTKPPYSVIDFRSRIPLNAGKEKPTHGQFYDFINYIRRNTCSKLPDSNDDFTPVFIQEQPPKVRRRKRGFQECEGDIAAFEEVPLMENARVQMKECTAEKKDEKESVKEGVKEGEKEGVNEGELMERCWKVCEEYIPAFSKNRHGGSIFIGVRDPITEQKSQGKKKKKTKAAGSSDALTTDKAQMQEPPSAAGSSDAFTTKGNKINNADLFKTNFREFLYKKLRQLTRWVGHEEINNHVEVELHLVAQPQNGQPRPAGERSDVNKYVIEVKIRHYRGICFHNAEGPYWFRGSWKSGGLKRQKTGVLKLLGKPHMAYDNMKGSRNVRVPENLGS